MRHEGKIAGLSLLLSVLAACAGPVPGSTPPPVTPTAPPLATPAPTPAATRIAAPTTVTGGPLTVTELKLRLLEKYTDFFYCDPDLYPVARGDELALALARWDLVKGDPEVFAALARNLRLEGTSTFSDDQKLAMYQAYKRVSALPLKAEGDGYAFTLRVSAGAGVQGFAVDGTVNRQGSIIETQRRAAITTCPICLPAGTRIATPNGPIPVEELLAGMPVWSQDENGMRAATTVRRVERTPVPAWHELVRVQLSDGRSILASPGHPSLDGVPLGAMRAGERLDGALVTAVSREAMVGEFTYDLLPDSANGAYWADGVLLRSTLR